MQNNKTRKLLIISDLSNYKFDWRPCDELYGFINEKILGF